MCLSYRLLLVQLLVSLAAFSQQTSFKLSFTDSLGKSIPEHQYRNLHNTNSKLVLDFKRDKSDKNYYEVFMVRVDRNKRAVKILIPGEGGREGMIIQDTVKSLTLDLVDVDIQRPDSIRLAVFVATGYNSFYYTLHDVADTSWNQYSWLASKHDSLFNSFSRLLNSDLRSLPSLTEMQDQATLKGDNLKPVEFDLNLAIDTRRAKICFKEIIDFNTKESGGNILTSYMLVKPAKSSSSLSWSKPKGFLLEPGKKSEMDEMVADAAAKHLKLMHSRGVEPNASEGLRFSLKELVETLSQWRNKVGLMLYSLDSSGLQILYADNSKKIDTIFIPVKKQRLDVLGSQLQALLLPGSSRGLKGSATSRPGTIDSLSRIISQLLLPSKFNLQELDHLVIIPAFNIATFPFAMLPVKDSLLLIDKMSYSIVPSINEFIITGQVRKQHFESVGRSDSRSLFKISGDSVYWSYTRPFLFVGAPSANKVGKYNFDPLPGTKLEIEMLSKKIPAAVVLMDQDAVKSKVTKAMKDAEIIYFATHGVADAEDPLNKSFILLSGKDDEAMLTAKEIQKLDLRASMVILSACETGLGKSHEGGMIGLSRAFEIAGAKNVLMSLWPVSDSKTPKLMQYFFEALENNGNGHVFFPHEAFRQAVLRFRKEQKDPVYWAAFSLFGVPL